MHLIRQTETTECGLACLAMIAGHHGHHLELSELRRRFLNSARGATLAQLMQWAEKLHMAGRPLRLEPELLPQLKLPCILHWDMNHFVVLKRVRRDWRGRLQCLILDPARGECRLSLTELAQHFTGVALELTPTDRFTQSDERQRLSIRQLAGRIVGLRRAAAQVIALALLLEVFTLCAPLFNQFIIDEVIVSGDRDLLVVLATGFALALLIQAIAGMARSWLLLRWNMEVGFQWATRVFSHLCRLPADYFLRRHTGDIVSRFASMGSIQSTLSSLCAESLLDGLMALLALGMMLLYSPRLCLVVLIAGALYALLRWLFHASLREASQERLVLAARESSYFLESVRAALPVKLFGREAQRCAHWQNLRQEVINRDVRTQQLGILFKLSNTAISGAQGLALLVMGAGLVMQNTLSIGMLMAFTSYATTFSTRLFTLVDLAANLRMLDLHAARLADIVLAPVEEDGECDHDAARFTGQLTLSGIRLRHGEGEPWLLDGVDLQIPAGQSLAITGASGCGKSTLCRVLLGLLQPEAGEVRLDGMPITRIGLRQYRQLVGTVMQDDTLLAGSIFDNIAFFMPGADPAQVERCARMAAVHDDIAAMPMGYLTLVGDMGSTLSGGQRQRILLARALYKQPRILVLDEATSHLDCANEARINQSLAALDITRIVIAHRAETIAAADLVVTLEQGRLIVH